MKSFRKHLEEEISKQQLDDLEKFADRILAKFEIDVSFTRHFLDRVNDSRNNPEITVNELQKLFKKIKKAKGVNLKKYDGMEVVLKDLQSNLNIPVVVKFKDGEFEVTNKTIMRKSNFRTPDDIIKYN
jgi:hypothetical protein